MPDNQLTKEIGMRLAEIRRSHNVTQEALSEMLDVSPKHISHTECGTSSLSLKNLAQVCEIFHCSMDYMVLGKSNDEVLNRIPAEIVQILHSDDEQELDRLNRYLQIYIELLNRNKE